MADLNVQGNKSFSSNYFCSGKFVSMHTTYHRYIVTPNEMLSFCSSALFCAWKKFRNKNEHWCVLSCLPNISFNKINMFSSLFMYHTVKSRHTCWTAHAQYHDMSTLKFWPCFRAKCKFCVCLPLRREKLVQPISFSWLAKVAGGNRKPTSQN